MKKDKSKQIKRHSGKNYNTKHYYLLQPAIKSILNGLYNSANCQPGLFRNLPLAIQTYYLKLYTDAIFSSAFTDFKTYQPHQK